VARLRKRRILPASSPVTLADDPSRIQGGVGLRVPGFILIPRVTADYPLLIDVHMSACELDAVEEPGGLITGRAGGGWRAWRDEIIVMCGLRSPREVWDCP
jgi:hypothetical protein